MLALVFIAKVSRGGMPLPLHESGSRGGVKGGAPSSLLSSLSGGLGRAALRLMRDRNYLISVIISPLMLF